MLLQTVVSIRPLWIHVPINLLIALHSLCAYDVPAQRTNHPCSNKVRQCWYQEIQHIARKYSSVTDLVRVC